MRSILGLLGFWLTVAACGGGRTQIPIGPVPEARTVGTLSGPLCRDTECSCRSGADDGGAGIPDGPRKRFEVRLLSAQALWVTLPNTVLYKNPEKAEACFYVDLPAGQTPIELRSSDANGVSAELFVRELGTTTKDWYETFHFECGNPGVCSFEELDALKAAYTGRTNNLFDTCGSTKVKSIVWDHGKAPDGMHPSELVVRAILDIYKFKPWKAHGDATCGEGGGRGARDGADGEMGHVKEGAEQDAAATP